MAPAEVPAVPRSRSAEPQGSQPIVLPGHDGLHHERKPRLRVILTATGVGAAALLAFLVLRDGRLPMASSQSDPGLVVPPASASPVAAPVSGVAVAFAAQTDSVLAAMHRYQVRQRDFSLHRIGCDALAVGYRDVDRGFVSLSQRFMAIRSQLDPAASGRYQQLAQRADAIDGQFGSTGCPRP